MATKRKPSGLLIVLPTLAGIVGGWILGTVLYNQAVREIEETSHLPANVAIIDLGDVWFGYTALSVFGDTLLGLLIGVFLYAFFKNQESKQFPTILRS